MSRSNSSGILLVFVWALVLPARAAEEWPRLRTYAADELRAVAMPLGGIGTGSVSLGGRGDLRDWEVVNRGARGWIPLTQLDPRSLHVGPFLALAVQSANGDAVVRLLEGPLDPPPPGDWGVDLPLVGLPRFAAARFDVAYPLATVHLSDPAIPLEVRLQAFNPLIPPDADRSGLPVAILRCLLRNPTDAAINATAVAMVPNFVGNDGWETLASRNRNTYRSTDQIRGIFMEGPAVPPTATNWGTLALTTSARSEVTHQLTWNGGPWNRGLAEFWSDLADDGRLTPVTAPAVDVPPATLATAVTIPPGEERSITFLLTWHFPHRRAWDTGRRADLPVVGNYAASRFVDAWHVAEVVAENLSSLEAETLAFVRTFLASDLPAAVQEAALFNLSTLRTQTVVRTADGDTFGWEGSGSVGGTVVGGRRQAGWGYGSCLHVWNYDLTTPYLFGDLAWRSRQAEFTHAIHPDGRLSTRIGLPAATHGTEHQEATADGQLGTLVRLHRDWQLSGRTDELESIWPAARRAMEFVWRSWDADQDGVLEGKHGSTLDVEWTGPHPQTAGWYLAALQATGRMAGAAGDPTFAWRCGELAARGRDWVEENLFNGAYLQQVLPPGRSTQMQVGAGCFADQLIGATAARASGLDPILDPAVVATALSSVLRHNRITDWRPRLNVMRSYVTGMEPGLVLLSFPRGAPPLALPPYAQEVWPGVEYGVATLLFYTGRAAEAERVVRDVRARHDGARRDPFDEVEFGHHYARSLAAWGGVLGATGFSYSAVDGRLTLAPGERTTFWSTGWAYGVLTEPGVRGVRTLEVRAGALPLAEVRITGRGTMRVDPPRTLSAGESLDLRLR